MTISQIPSIILRDPTKFWTDTALRGDLNKVGTKLLCLNILFFTAYGALLGFSTGPLQAVASAGKLPILFLASMFVCFPTLHVLNLLFGAKSTVREMLVLTLLSLAGTAVLLLGFAPISLFFLITSDSEAFFRLLNIGFMAISAAFGLKLFYSGMRTLDESGDRTSAALRLKVLRFWVCIYAFVGCQMAWTMRPFFGSPSRPFEVFRPMSEKGNFYMSINHSMQELLGLRGLL